MTAPSRHGELPLIAGALALLGLCLAALPLRNWDYWYHLVLGRLLDVHHAVPTTNIFGYTAPPTTPVFVQGWIGDYWLYRLHELGALSATLTARNLCALAALALVAYAAWRLAGRNGRITALTTLSAGLVFLAVGAFAGPQMFAWPLFGLLLVVHTLAWERDVPVFVVAFVAAAGAGFWANLSNGFWLPPVIALCFAFAEGRRGERSRALALAGAAVLAFLAMFATPHGPGIVQGIFDPTGIEVWLLLGMPAALAPIVARFGQRPLPFPRWASIATAVMLAVVTIAAQPWTEEHAAIPAAVFGDAVRQSDPLRGHGPSTIPVEAVEVLRSWGSQPRVYAEPHFSGYLLYELQDPRVPQPIVWPVPDRIVPPGQLALERAMYEQPEVLRGALQQFEVDAVLATPDEPRIGAAMRKLADWRVAAEWSSGTLFIRDPARR